MCTWLQVDHPSCYTTAVTFIVFTKHFPSQKPQLTLAQTPPKAATQVPVPLPKSPTSAPAALALAAVAAGARAHSHPSAQQKLQPFASDVASQSTDAEEATMRMLYGKRVLIVEPCNMVSMPHSNNVTSVIYATSSSQQRHIINASVNDVSVVSDGLIEQRLIPGNDSHVEGMQACNSIVSVVSQMLR